MGLVLLCPTWESRDQERQRQEMRERLSKRQGQAKSEKGMKIVKESKKSVRQ